MDDVLNGGEWPSGAWFYLDGSSPSLGGICVIEGSHRHDFAETAPLLRGHAFTANRRSFFPTDAPPRGFAFTDNFWSPDVPGCVPIVAAPNDLILFAARTYHASFPLPATIRQPRRTVAMTFRGGHTDLGQGWPQTAGAAALYRKVRDAGDTEAAACLQHYFGVPSAEEAGNYELSGRPVVLPPPPPPLAVLDRSRL